MDLIKNSDLIPVEQQARNACAHCGAQCGHDAVSLNEQRFCCSGCRQVYQLIHENGLESYYQLNESPGIRIKSQDESRYGFLDEEEVTNKFLRLRRGDVLHVVLRIPDIHCSSCVWLLENLHRFEEGIHDAKVNMMRKELQVKFDKSVIPFSKIGALLDRLGYLPELSLEERQSGITSRSDTRLLIQLGISGFCFGNIMLLSFPEYLGLEEELFATTFRYLILALTVPVMFIGARGYFQSAWEGLKRGFISIDVPLSIGISSLLGWSLYEIFWLDGAGYLDSLAGLVFFLLIGKWFQSKTWDSLRFDRQLLSYFPLAVQRKTEAGYESISVEKLETNDEIFIRNGEVVPCKSVLLSDRADIDYSFISGESDPVKVTKGQEIFAGGRQVGAAIELSVLETDTKERLTSMWEMNENPAKENWQPKGSGLVSASHDDRVTKYFTIAILVIAFGTLAFWLFHDAEEAAQTFAAVLIVACPCGLALTAPFAFGQITRGLGRKGLFLKGPESVSKIREIDHIVFDKTGTLTDVDSFDVEYEGREIAAEDLRALANLFSNSLHPLSQILLQHLGIPAPMTIEEYQEESGKGLTAKIGGKRYRIGSRSFVGGKSAAEKLQEVWIEMEGEVFGCYSIHKRFRAGLEELSGELGRSYDISIISGDNDADRDELSGIFPDGTEMRFHTSPNDKLEFVKALQSNGARVMMIGDGLNDAGALSQADCGVAVAENHNSFTPGSDAILQGKVFGRLASLLAATKNVNRVVYAGYAVSFTYNLCGLAFAVTGNLSPLVAAILMPLSSISVIIISTLGARLVTSN